MAIYEWNQNNSGGSYHNDMASYVFVSASTHKRANVIAEAYGVYKGYKSGDCTEPNDCCGERWNEGKKATDEGVQLLNELCAAATLEQDVKLVEGNYTMRLQPIEAEKDHLSFMFIMDGDIEE